ncbi:MAG: N-acetylglucosamine-6-phosphate deacetylase [Oscillospiraceae bacterium]|nr:N-acetylglucosamine-6-phosphate deacetylase [Oscillospiraceae bacterium]
MEYIGNVILPEGVLRGCRVVCEDGIIRAITSCQKNDTDLLPYIAPGFIDIHNHGAMGHDYMEATAEAFDAVRRHLTRHGVTATQPTTVSAPLTQLADFFKAYRSYQSQAGEDMCRFVGIHIEGPYIASAAKGAHQLDTLLTPAKDGYGWLLDNRDIIGEVTVAPELAGMPQMIRDLRQAGIVVSGGHDAAEPEDIEAAAEAGMSHCTHIYCAMSTLHKTNGQRRHGLCEHAMTHSNITAEMIADNHHVPPLLAKMIHKAKGADHVCLVSDAIAPAGLPESDELYRLGTGEDCTMVRVEDGVAMVADRSCYAGSVQALDQMVRNMVFDAGLPLADAVRMASLTPAGVIGLDECCGSIAVGKRADLCMLDASLNVIRTVIAGKVVWEKGV